jgi:hypothetical protein
MPTEASAKAAALSPWTGGEQLERRRLATFNLSNEER